MNLPDLTAALQTFHKTIPGVTRADAQPPLTVNPSDLPLVATYAGPATSTPLGPAWVKVTRRMSVRCLVVPVAMGRPVAEGYERTVPVLNAFLAAYLGDYTLGGAVNTLTTLSDSGVITLTPGGAGNAPEYWGFELTATVENIVNRLAVASASPLATANVAWKTDPSPPRFPNDPYTVVDPTVRTQTSPTPTTQTVTTTNPDGTTTLTTATITLPP